MRRLRVRDRQGTPRLGLVVPALVAALLALALALPAGASAAVEFSFAVNVEGEGEVQCKIKEPGEEVLEEEFCDGSYPANTQITVEPLAEEGSKFAGFKNGTGSAAVCNGRKVSCTFTINANSSLDAQFVLSMLSLAINVEGEGEIECEVVIPEQPVQVGICDEEFPENAKITLEPAPEEEFEFSGFTGGTGSAAVCNGKKVPCTFTITTDSSVNAPFNPTPEHTLTIEASGPGSVTGSPGSINCGPTCSEKVLKGTKLTLAAHPDSGAVFAGWAGGGCKGLGTCTVTVDADTTVAAEFEPKPPPEKEDEEPKLKVKTGTAKAAGTARVKAGKAALKLTCSGGPCKGTLQLTAKVKQGKKAKSLTIGKASFSLAAGASTTLSVKLSGPAKQELAKGKTVKAKLGGTGIAGSTVKLKSAAK